MHCPSIIVITEQQELTPTQQAPHAMFHLRAASLAIAVCKTKPLKSIERRRYLYHEKNHKGE